MNQKPVALVTVKPSFDSLLVAAEMVPVCMAGITGFTFIGGTLFLTMMSLIGLGSYLNIGAVYFTVLLIAIIAVPTIFYELKRWAYAHTYYALYPDYLEFQDFRLYFKRRRSRLRYVDIGAVLEQAGNVQQRQQVQTIYLMMLGSGYRVALPLLIMRDIPVNAGLADRLRELIEQALDRQYMRRVSMVVAEPAAVAPPAVAQVMAESQPELQSSAG